MTTRTFIILTITLLVCFLPACGSSAAKTDTDPLVTTAQVNQVVPGPDTWVFEQQQEFGDPNPGLCRHFSPDPTPPKGWYVTLTNCRFDVGPDLTLDKASRHYLTAAKLTSQAGGSAVRLFSYMPTTEQIAYDEITLHQGTLFLARLAHRSPAAGDTGAPQPPEIDEVLHAILKLNIEQSDATPN